MSTAIAVAPGSLIETVVIKGDLAPLTPAERANYYRAVCQSLGLNPLTRPFEYITLNGKLTLYARKDCTDQLRSLNKVSVLELTESERGDVFIVTAKMANSEGRTDMAKGAVSIAGLKGEALANAMMKAETKAKRRATLSLCGLGMLDETEAETIVEPGSGREPAPAPRGVYDPATGEVIPASPEATQDKPSVASPEASPSFAKATEGPPSEARQREGGYLDAARKVAVSGGREALRTYWGTVPKDSRHILQANAIELGKLADKADNAQKTQSTESDFPGDRS